MKHPFSTPSNVLFSLIFLQITPLIPHHNGHQSYSCFEGAWNQGLDNMLSQCGCGKGKNEEAKEIPPDEQV